MRDVIHNLAGRESAARGRASQGALVLSVYSKDDACADSGWDCLRGDKMPINVYVQGVRSEDSVYVAEVQILDLPGLVDILKHHLGDGEISIEIVLRDN